MCFKAKILIFSGLIVLMSCSFNKISNKNTKKDIDMRPFLGYNETDGRKSILMEGDVDYKNKVWEWEARFKNE